MRIVLLFVLLSMSLIGCSHTEPGGSTGQQSYVTHDKQTNWKVSPTFETITKVPSTGKSITHKWRGRKGRLAVNENEPFVANAMAKRSWMIWGDPEKLVGKKARIVATSSSGITVHIPSGESIVGEIGYANGVADLGTMFSLPEQGLWRLDLYAGDERFDSLVVEVK